MIRIKDQIQKTSGTKKFLVGAFIASSLAGYQLLSTPTVVANDTSSSYRVFNPDFTCDGSGGNCLPTFTCCC